MCGHMKISGVFVVHAAAIVDNAYFHQYRSCELRYKILDARIDVHQKNARFKR